MLSLNKLRRKLIGGIWIKQKEDSFYRYCTDGKNGWLSHYDPIKGCYWGLGRTNIGIEVLEDYGKVTLLGDFFGYSDNSSRNYNSGISFLFWGCIFTVMFFVIII